MEGKDVQKGLRVTYIPRNARTDYSKRELGVISSWNDSFVFVDYGTGTNKATKYEDLMVGDETFYCPDEHNSVIDMAFGRCETECVNCRARRIRIIN